MAFKHVYEKFHTFCKTTVDRRECLTYRYYHEIQLIT